MSEAIETRVLEKVLPAQDSAPQVGSAFRKLLDSGIELRPAGEARKDPASLLALGYTPRHALRLFDVRFFLTNPRFDADLGFFVAYVLRDGDRAIHPRIFYKDVSLVWRVATHHVRTDGDNWIGKGDLKSVVQNGEEIEYGAEETTNLPLEIQSTLDAISRRVARARPDHRAVDLVLRGAPEGRFEPYGDFSAPRRRAMADPRNRIHGGRSVARFTRKNDPSSLRFAAGFEPDFRRGIIELSESGSRLYGGGLRKYRVLSANRKIQYQFLVAPRHVWIVPPQALTTQLSTYGVRTVDVEADEDLFVPGYEYHFIDEHEDPPQLHSQIPEGYAGEPSEIDPSRADASAWLEQLPVIRRFRKELGIPRR